MHAYWKNQGCYVALKSFNTNKTTRKNIVKEIKLHKEVDFHSNIIRIFGITSEETVLMWLISSGKRSFYDEDTENDERILNLRIINGERETIICGTPIEYSNLYEQCWKYEPDERPNIQDVVSTLGAIISKNSEMEVSQNQISVQSDTIISLNNSSSSSSQIINWNQKNQKSGEISQMNNNNVSNNFEIIYHHNVESN
ncbi:6536_t:CDS:2, partial [Funneliformis mosseae]